jgi:hypothetical protein
MLRIPFLPFSIASTAPKKSPSTSGQPHTHSKVSVKVHATPSQKDIFVLASPEGKAVKAVFVSSMPPKEARQAVAQIEARRPATDADRTKAQARQHQAMGRTGTGTDTQTQPIGKEKGTTHGITQAIQTIFRPLAANEQRIGQENQQKHAEQAAQSSGMTMEEMYARAQEVLAKLKAPQT